jgi:hypothetical protein
LINEQLFDEIDDIIRAMPPRATIRHENQENLAWFRRVSDANRYVFVDRLSCYQSGASFKDGAKSAPTTLTQITDAFAPVLKTNEDIWSRAQVEC